MVSSSESSVEVAASASSKPELKNKEKLRLFGERGLQLLETSRQIAAGEKDFKLSFGPSAGSVSGAKFPTFRADMDSPCKDTGY